MPQTTFWEELMAAGRGTLALLMGDRQAGRHFDFSRRGLYGSFVALLLVAAIGAFLPIVVSKDHDSAIVSLLQLAILFLAQLACAVLVLRQFKRMDALVPYLVADNWANFFITLIFGALLAAGVIGDIPTILVGIAVIVLEVNIGRIVMTLSPLQIASLIIAQIVGVLLAMGIIILLFPMPPDVAAQLATLGS